MQTIAVISSPSAGIVYINGRFAGECGNENPVILPVNPHGTMYIELKPLTQDALACAHRIDFHGGQVRAESVPEGVYVIKWPGGVTEIEIIPRPAVRDESVFGSMDGLPIAILRDEGTNLRVGGEKITIPEGAALPDTHTTCAAEVFIGDTKRGRYAACFAKNTLTPLGAVSADLIDIEGSVITAITNIGDTAGHARIENWEAANDRLTLLSTEYAWEKGAPGWPRDADHTALAAFEAHFLGLNAEAEGYLNPRIRGAGVITLAARDCDTCVPLRYAPPSAERGIGLLHRETNRCADVKALYFRASPDGGAQGAWLIDEIRQVLSSDLDTQEATLRRRID